MFYINVRRLLSQRFVSQIWAIHIQEIYKEVKTLSSKTRQILQLYNYRFENKYYCSQKSCEWYGEIVVRQVHCIFVNKTNIYSL